MKTFEERYTAWVDGQLMGPELIAFERELEQTPDALNDKHEAGRLGSLLRQHLQAPALANPDFFNHQISHRIAVDTPLPAQKKSRVWWAWSLPRLAWAGAASLAVAAALFLTIVPGPSPAQGGIPYFAEIVDVRTSDPNISATPVYDPQENVTVLWIDGLDYLPASYKLQ